MHQNSDVELVWSYKINRGLPPRDELQAFWWTKLASEMRLWVCFKKKKKHVAFSSVFPRRGSIHVMHLKTCATGSKHAQQFLRLLSGPLSATPSCGLFPAMPPQVHTVPQFQHEAVGRRWEDGGGRQSDQRVPVSHFTHDQMPPATKETAPGATHTSSGSASVRMCSRSGMAAA